MAWLVNTVRFVIAPVLVGAASLALHRPSSPSTVGGALGLALLAAIHLGYWSAPWSAGMRRAVIATAAIVALNAVLIHVFHLRQPLLWLYPALIVGAGFRPFAAAIGVALLALSAGTSMDLDGSTIARTLGPNHAVLFSVVLAGLGMNAVRQLIAVNADLHATKAELAELAVASERERLARELHDVLGRTLSLIAVKAELASRLSAKGDATAGAELRDVQRLARDAVREVREAVTGERVPSVAAELDAARAALRTAGIELVVDASVERAPIEHEITIAWALREAVTNVVKHSGALTCRVRITVDARATTLEVGDDGRGSDGAARGLGLTGLADRVHALRGEFEAADGDAGGFRVRVELPHAAVPDEREGAR